MPTHLIPGHHMHVLYTIETHVCPFSLTLGTTDMPGSCIYRIGAGFFSSDALCDRQSQNSQHAPRGAVENEGASSPF